MLLRRLNGTFELLCAFGMGHIDKCNTDMQKYVDPKSQRGLKEMSDCVTIVKIEIMAKIFC